MNGKPALSIGVGIATVGSAPLFRWLLIKHEERYYRGHVYTLARKQNLCLIKSYRGLFVWCRGLISLLGIGFVRKGLMGKLTQWEGSDFYEWTFRT